MTLDRIQTQEYQSLRSFLKKLDGSDRQLHRMLAAAIEQELTPRQAQMVRMYFLEQHSMREMARILDVYPSTVSRTLGAARVKLRRCLRYGAKALLDAGADGEEPF